MSLHALKIKKLKINHSFVTHGEHDDLNEEIQYKQSSIEVVDRALNEVTNFSSIRVKNPKKIIIGHLNINSIPNKLSSIMEIIKGKLDIFLISETKIDESFPTSQFSAEGFTKPFRHDRKIGAGGLLLYVNENIPAKELRNPNPANDMETS